MPAALSSFHPPTAEWFAASFRAPTAVQEKAWPVISGGGSALVLAPTGSGKTLAAFLWAIDRMMFAPVPDRAARCRVLYVSPLKALAVDVEKNLRAPLVGVMRAAERRGDAVHVPAVFVRTGDTPAAERAAFRRNPADILITTPESLYLMLTSGSRETLRAVETVIVDEVHAVAATKRGAHLALTLERLEELVPRPLQRIGLSATVRPVDEVARFLGGHGDDGLPRPVTIVDAGRRRRLELTVSVPLEDMSRLGEAIEIPSGPAAQGTVRRSIWPSLHPVLLDLVRGHRSTIVFCNSRRLAERLAAAVNELAGEDLVRAHHGSLAREQRIGIEDRLKAGALRGIVATSSLELGIDMGAVDLVVQVESPPSVASGIQRIGRAGHQVDAPSKGVILPKFRGDLLASAALTERMVAGEVEAMRVLRNPLDVLAQQLVAAVAVEEREVEGLGRLVRRAAPFASLSPASLAGVLDMLAGRYPSDDFADLAPRVVWDRIGGTVRAREGARRVAVSSGGTIPDRGLYGVFLQGAPPGKGRVGELDEEMVFESRTGEVFLLGASSWRIEEITHDRVLVSPAPGEPGKMPFWKGESGHRPLEFGRAIGALTRTLSGMPGEQARALLRDRHFLDDLAAGNLLAYLRDQAEAAGAVPDDRTVVLERFVDEMGDWRVCLLCPFGGKVLAPWATAIAARVAERGGPAVDVLWTDDGIVARFPDSDRPPDPDLFFPDPDEVEPLVVRQIASGGGEAHGMARNALFASRFREAAGRALLLPRRFPGKRAPLWQQRLRSAQLLEVAARYGDFPIVLETYREILQDVFDLPALRQVLSEVRSRALRVAVVDTRAPSPFAAALLFNYVANFMYEGDAPLAERRAQALAVDPAQLRELLGEVELRELLDPGALAQAEARLQALEPARAARDADGVHDLLRRLGDLAPDEVAARCAEPVRAASWLASLEEERRAIRLRLAGEERWAAAEDAGRYREALGAPVPSGLPAAFLEAGDDPLAGLLARWARTRGPFADGEPARRWGLPLRPVREALSRLAEAGRVVEGEFRPGGHGAEWCDAGVLRQVRQRSLARLRREVEPVDPVVLGRLLPAWQRADAPRAGRAALEEALSSLQGAALPASDLETRILPARVAGYEPFALDRLLSTGQILWTGAGSLGPRDGRVRLVTAEHAALLLSEPAHPPSGGVHGRLRAHLAARGASFFPQIAAAVGGFPGEVLDALWDLVWAGEVGNDTLEPLRAFTAPPRRRGPGRVSPTSVGRWGLVASWFPVPGPTPTERRAAWARQLLERHGVLVREAVAAEGLEGGFSAVYPVLRGMEEAGRIRRGYFVAGQGAAQFALPGAVDRLREAREPAPEPRALLLAAADPANPYGAALPWPERADGRRPARAAGALAVLVDGALAAWMGRGERRLLTWLDGPPDREREETARAVARALAAEAAPGRRRVVFVEHVDDGPVAGSPLDLPLREEGFVPTAHGHLRRRET